MDTKSKEPLEVFAVGWGNPNYPQIRVLVHNRRTLPVRVVTTPLDSTSTPMSGWDTIAPWGGVHIPNAIPISGLGWAEYWIESSPGQRLGAPQALYLLASYATFRAGATQTIPIEYDQSTAPIF